MRRVWKCLIILCGWHSNKIQLLAKQHVLHPNATFRLYEQPKVYNESQPSHHPLPTARHWLRGPVTRGRGGNSWKGRELEYSTVMLPESVVTNKTDKENVTARSHFNWEQRSRKSSFAVCELFSAALSYCRVEADSIFFFSPFFSFSFFHKRMACSQQWVVNKCHIHQPHPFQYPFQQFHLQYLFSSL